MFLVSVVVRVRGWMVQRRVPGCSFVEAHMSIFTQGPNDMAIHDKNTNAYFTKRDFFDMPKENAPNSSEKQHRKKLCGSKRGKSGPTYQRDPRRNATPCKWEQISRVNMKQGEHGASATFPMLGLQVQVRQPPAKRETEWTGDTDVRYRAS